MFCTSGQFFDSPGESKYVQMDPKKNPDGHKIHCAHVMPVSYLMGAMGKGAYCRVGLSSDRPPPLRLEVHDQFNIRET